MAETLNTHEEPTPSEEQIKHEEAMIAKADKLGEGETAKERPEWLPEKFKSPEDMANAYTQLEKKMGTGKAESSEETKEEVEEENTDPQDLEAPEVAKVLDKAGVDFNALQAEYVENKGITEESYEALEKAGFPKTLVDTWIAGQESLVNDISSKVYSSVGGEENYKSMLDWASDALPDSEVEAFNQAINSGDMNMVNFAVNGLAARYQTEVGTEPTLVQGEVTGNSGGSFNSAAELTAAMRDPRYHNDPAYRKAVTDKLSRSSVF
jgi:hypothetical protein